jgi:long-chain acyl-CoA synthetase
VKSDTHVLEPSTDVYDSRPWLAHYPENVPGSIQYPRQTIYELLSEIAASYGDLTAFIFQGRELTYRQVLRQADRMAGALRQSGVRKGDVVAVLLPNVPHFPIAYYGILKLGARVAAIPPNSVEREIERYLEDCGAKAVITLDLLFAKLGQSFSESAAVEHVIVGKVTDFMPWWIRRAARFSKKVPKPTRPVPYGGKVRGFLSFLKTGSNVDFVVDVQPEDVALLQYTGGTTGLPKAALLTHHSLLANARQMKDWFPQLRQGQETILAVLPFFHVYGVTLVMNAGLLLAARTVLIAGGWVPSEVFESIRRYRPTIFPGVPTLYVALCNDERSRKYDLRSIDICVSGGAPLPDEVRRDFEALTGGHLYEGYGLSEASPMSHAQPYDGTGKLGSIGMPVPDTEARIVDSETGRPVQVGVEGELCIRGPQIMAGYWQRPDDTDQVLRDGWLFTGDIARMDDDGYFTIVDRKKDLIITSGENVYPREIEEVLFEHPKIKEVAVVGVPHPYGGEIAKAFIVLRSGEQATKKDIIQFAAQRLSKHKVPRAVEFRTELPKSPAQKVLRRVLADEERSRQAGRVRRVADNTSEGQ